MTRFALPLAAAAVVVFSACASEEPPRAPPVYAYPQYAPQQGYPPPQGYPQQRYPQQGYPQQPYPQQSPPQTQPLPGVMSSDPDVVAACRKAEADWQRSCGCPVSILVDMNSMQGITDHYGDAHDFELQGKHFCQAISSGTDLHGHDVSIGTFCRGRERDMCRIGAFRFARVPHPQGYDCTMNGNVAVPQSAGDVYSLVDNCYRRVTRW